MGQEDFKIDTIDFENDPEFHKQAKFDDFQDISLSHRSIEMRDMKGRGSESQSTT